MAARIDIDMGEIDHGSSYFKGTIRTQMVDVDPDRGSTAGGDGRNDALRSVEPDGVLPTPVSQRTKSLRWRSTKACGPLSPGSAVHG